MAEAYPGGGLGLRDCRVICEIPVPAGLAFQKMNGARGGAFLTSMRDEDEISSRKRIRACDSHCDELSRTAALALIFGKIGEEFESDPTQIS